MMIEKILCGVMGFAVVLLMGCGHKPEVVPPAPVASAPTMTSRTILAEVNQVVNGKPAEHCSPKVIAGVLHVSCLIPLRVDPKHRLSKEDFSRRKSPHIEPTVFRYGQAVVKLQFLCSCDEAPAAKP